MSRKIKFSVNRQLIDLACKIVGIIQKSESSATCSRE